MNKDFLLPYSFKKIGWIMFFPFLGVCMWLLLGPGECNCFDIPVFALFSDSHLSIIGESLNLSSGTGFAPGITSTDPINELAMLGLLISIVFIALSREKDEDEMTPIVRQKAFSLSFWITSALYAMVILFVYGISFLNFTFAMPYFFFIMYIVIFNISMSKLRRGEYEK